MSLETETQQELTERLRNLPSSRETMPSGMRDRMRQQLAEAEAPVVASVSPFSQRFVIPMALAASLVLGVFLEKQFEFGSSFVHQEVAQNIGVYIADVTHDHYLLERIDRPLEVEITDANDLSAWLSASLSFDFELPAADRSYSLQGGRVWHTVGRLSALASYATASGSRVVLFAVPAANLELLVDHRLNARLMVCTCLSRPCRRAAIMLSTYSSNTLS